MRGRRVVHVRRAQASLAEGREPRLGLEISSALAAQALATWVVTAAAFLAAGSVLEILWPLLPEALRSGARCAVVAAPWLGAGGLAASLWRKS